MLSISLETKSFLLSVYMLFVAIVEANLDYGYIWPAGGAKVTHMALSQLIF